MHFAAYLAAVTGPGLVLWKSILEPASFSAWNAALTTWFSQFWCMSSIIRSASSTIWIQTDKKHYLLNATLNVAAFFIYLNLWTRIQDVQKFLVNRNAYFAHLSTNEGMHFCPKTECCFHFSCSVANWTLRLHTSSFALMQRHGCI